MGMRGGVSGCKLLCTEWVNNKVLLYSAENYIQYPMINHNGQEYKSNVCVYIYICVCVCVCVCARACVYN